MNAGKSPIIYLVRHGETEWNTHKRRQGHKDSPLTERGRGQAKKNGKTLRRHIAPGMHFALLSSPLGRAKETASILAEELGIPAELITYESRLKECNFGVWEGLTEAEIKHKFAEEWDARASDRWNTPAPGGESYSDVHSRVSEWYANAPFAEITVVVCHGLTSRVFRGIYSGLSESQVFELSETQDGLFELRDGTVSLIDE